MSVVEGYIVDGSAVAGSAIAGSVVGALGVDPLAALSDDFSTGSTMTGNGWTIEDTAGSGSTPSDTITSGEADLTVALGGTGGSFWFDGNDGVLWYKTVTGACDFRARVRVRNAGDTGLPPTTSFRIGGIQAADPDRTTYEYVHVGIGAANIAAAALESKTTDNNVSTYAGSAATLTGGAFLYDLRLVRTAADTQVFLLYTRAGTSSDLDDDTGWTLLETVDRSDNSIPSRTSAVPLPNTLRWGFMLYGLANPPNIRMFVAECLFKTPTS